MRLQRSGHGIRWWIVVLALLSTAAVVASDERQSAAASAADYAQAEQAWRAERASRLQKPGGWLSLVGLHWIEPGSQLVGSAADADVRLATGPAHLGTLEWSGAVVQLHDPHPALRIDGEPPVAPVSLRSDADGAATVVGIDDGVAGLYLIERAGRLALRVWDDRAAARTGFRGLAWFDPSADWRLDARFVTHPAGRSIDIASVTGSVEPTPNPGRVEFEVDGHAYTLEALGAPGEPLFLIFADRSNARDTYGGGRFLYTDPPTDGRVVLDFNRAINPPCAFNAWSTCPLPPAENRLDLAVTAGERRYPGYTADGTTPVDPSVTE